MQGAPQGRPQQRPPEGQHAESPLPAGRAAAGQNLPQAGAEGTPVGLPTRRQGVSTVSRPERQAQGTTEEGAGCTGRRRVGLGDGRQKGGAQSPPT